MMQGDPPHAGSAILESNVSGQRRRDLFCRTCPARVPRQVRERARPQLSRARDARRGAARFDRALGGLHTAQAVDPRDHGQARPPVHERSRTLQDRESFCGKRGKVFLRRGHAAIEGAAAGRAGYGRHFVGNGYEPGAVPSRGLVPWKTGEPMNRSFFIIMIPALLVAAGYIVVLRFIGIAPGYPRLIVAMVLFFGMIYWLSRRSGRKANSNRA